MPKKAKTFFGNLEQALEADKNHIYIGNNLKGRAVLLLDIKDASGKSISVKIPKTWVPIDLMLFADREAIRRSDSIRKLHRKGAIRFLDANEADEIMKTQEAREEAKRAGLLSELGQDLVDMMAQEEEAKKAQETAIQVFEQGAAGGDLPQISGSAGLGILDAFVAISFVSSKGEARRLIKQNGLKLNDKPITDENYRLSADDFIDGQAKLSQGKKKHGLVKL